MKWHVFDIALLALTSCVIRMIEMSFLEMNWLKDSTTSSCFVSVDYGGSIVQVIKEPNHNARWW